MTIKKDEMGLNRGLQYRFQEIKIGINNITMSRTLYRQQRNIATTYACKTVLGVALRQKQGNGLLKPIAIASSYLNDAKKKKYSIGKVELLAVV